MRLNEEVKRRYSVTVCEGVKRGACGSVPSPGWRWSVFPLLFLAFSCVFLFLLSPLSAWAVVPNAPSGLTATALLYSQIRIDWIDNSGDETRFYIERKIGEGGVYTQLTNVITNVTTYSNSGLVQNTVYYYRVRAYNASGYSSYSNEVSVTTPPQPVPAAPSNLSATALSSTQISISWSDNSGDETRFYIERKIGEGGVYTQLTNVGTNVTTYTNSGLAQNTVYYYRVRANNAGGYSTYSNEVSATTLPLNAPSDLSVSAASYSTVNLAWTDNSADETRFYIERSVGGPGAYTQLTSVGANVTTYTNTGLAQNTVYYYRVRANNAGGYSTYSNEVSATTLPLNAPSDLSVSAASDTAVSLAWMDNSAGESGFRIERKAGAGGTYAVIANVGANVTSYANTGLKQGTEYYYRVLTYSGSNYSTYSNEVNVTTSTSLPSPSEFRATPVSSTQINLTWTDNSNDETYFYIERKTGASGTYLVIANVEANVTTYLNAGLSVNTEYYYRVRAYNESGYSTYSNEASAVTLSFSAPSDLTAVPLSSTQIKLKWTDNSSDEQYFYIERKTGAAGTYSTIGSVGENVTTYLNTGLSVNTEYYYRVRAYNASGYSTYSNETSAITPGCSQEGYYQP